MRARLRRRPKSDVVSYKAIVLRRLIDPPLPRRSASPPTARCPPELSDTCTMAMRIRSFFGSIQPSVPNAPPWPKVPGECSSSVPSGWLTISNVSPYPGAAQPSRGVHVGRENLGHGRDRLLRKIPPVLVMPPLSSIW